MNDADIPAKPAYVPIEGSLGIAPAISTSTVVGSSLKGMAFVQLFKLATNKTAACRAAGNHLIITVKCDLEKGVRDIDVLVMESSTRYVLLYRSITIIRLDSLCLASLD
jgi:hypothetical protein